MKLKNIKSVSKRLQDSLLTKVECTFENWRTNERFHEVFFLDNNGKIVAKFKNKTPFLVEQLTSKYNSLFVVRHFDIFHIILVYYDLTDTVINSYEDIEFGVEDGCFAVKYNGLWGFINEEAIEIIEPQYDNYCAFNNGFAAVCKNGKWGFINKNNELIIPFEYDIAYYTCFNGGYAPVSKNGRFGFIDVSNRTVIPFVYKNALMRSKYGKLFPVKVNDKWGFIDIHQNEVIPFEFDNIECDCDGYSVYHVMKKFNEHEFWGLVDARLNKQIVFCKYLSLCPNPNSIQAHKLNGKYVLLNWEGEEISQEFDYIEEYSSEGLYKYAENDIYGYIDETGKCIINPQYKNLSGDFTGGLTIVVNKDFSKSIINTSGKIIIELKQDQGVSNIGKRNFLIENIETKEYELVNI